MQAKPHAILFDAYGTLFDVYSVGQRAEQLFPGQGAALSRLWRDKQIEYTRLRSMAGQYKPFWDVTIDALRYSGQALGLALDHAAEQVLMSEYAKLSAFSENLIALTRIKAAGIPMAVHSNGNPQMIQAALQSAGMTSFFDVVLSADQVRKYKIDAAVYQLAVDHFRVPAAQMLFVSSNGWDVCGAAWFGFQTFWVNRSALPHEQLDIAPTYVGHNLSDLAELVVGSV
jgi:2-haloacid dehalogenase